MILTRLTLCDFRAFRDVHHITLEPKNKEGTYRPIILLGGLNGSGKTTLLLAIKLALYGRHAIGMGTSKAKYSEYIRSCIHSSTSAFVQPNRSYVELSFVYGKLGQSSHYVVRRSWYDSGKEIREQLSLYEDGIPRTGLSPEACQGFLNELVPLGVAELFFFDGEKIALLAEDDSGRVLGDAIHRLLGLDLIERLRNDLRVYMLRQETKTAAKDVAQEIEAMQGEYEQVVSELNVSNVELKTQQEEFEALLVKRDRVEVRLMERGGDWGKSKEEQRASAKKLTDELQHDKRLLREELAGCYPLFLASEVLIDALRTASSNLQSLAAYEANELLQKFASKLNQALDAASRSVVTAVLDSSLLTIDRTLLSFDISPRALGRMEHTVNCAVPEAQERIKRLHHRITSLKGALDTISLRVEQAPDQAALVAEFEKLSDFNKRISEAEVQIAVRQRDVRANYAKAIELARLLRNKHRILSERQESQLPLDYANGTRQLLKELRYMSASRMIAQLEQEFVGAFRRLSHKQDAVKEIRIDPRRFTVTLLDHNLVEVAKSQLSAGEKQIYAIAMLEALARTSGRRLPVVIDTPLGRLDSHHRENLVAHYFPSVSHQVVLLSTDTEVDESFHQTLLPEISHSSEIWYDETEHSSKIRDGYFWSKCMRSVS